MSEIIIYVDDFTRRIVDCFVEAKGVCNGGGGGGGGGGGLGHISSSAGPD